MKRRSFHAHRPIPLWLLYFTTRTLDMHANEFSTAMLSTASRKKLATALRAIVLGPNLQNFVKWTFVILS